MRLKPGNMYQSNYTKIEDGKDQLSMPRNPILHFFVQYILGMPSRGFSAVY